MRKLVMLGDASLPAFAGPALRVLISHKWKTFGKSYFFIKSLIYLVYLLLQTYSATKEVRRSTFNFIILPHTTLHYSYTNLCTQVVFVFIIISTGAEHDTCFARLARDHLPRDVQHFRSCCG